MAPYTKFSSLCCSNYWKMHLTIKKGMSTFLPMPSRNSPPGSISKRNRTSQEIFHTKKQIRFREESEFDFDKLSWEQCFLLERYSGMAPKHLSLNIWIWTLILHTNQLHRMMTLKSWQKQSCWRIHNLNCRKKKKRGSKLFRGSRMNERMSMLENTRSQFIH